MSKIVPQGWVEKRIGDCCEILDSKRIPLNSEERAIRKGHYPYYGANGIQDYIDDFIFDGDAILLAEDGGNFDQYANRPIAQWVTGKYWVNNHAHILRSREKDLDKWIYYSLVHKNILKFINGGTRAKLNQSDLKEIEVLSPPLPEQKKIVSILTSVDEVIEKTNVQINKLQDLKKGLIQEFLTRGMGHTEFKESNVGVIPKEWGVVELHEVLSKLTDCEHKTAPYVEKSEYLVVRTNNVKNGQLHYEDIKFTTEAGFREWTSRRIPRVGDILFTREAPAGESCLVPHDLNVCLGQRMVLLTPKTTEIRSDFLSIYLSSEISKRLIYRLSIGTTVSRINIEDIYKIPCVVPSLHEQKKITQAVFSVDSLIKVKSQSLASLKNFKKALMQDLLSGQVRVKVN